jgi:hypothetical protein
MRLCETVMPSNLDRERRDNEWQYRDSCFEALKVNAVLSPKNISMRADQTTCQQTFQNTRVSAVIVWSLKQ